MTDLTEAFNHAARMSDPAYLRKQRRHKEYRARRMFSAGKGKLFIKEVDGSFRLLGEAALEMGRSFDHLGDALRYAFPKSVTMIFTGKYTTPRWYHRVWAVIRRFLVWISNLD